MIYVFEYSNIDKFTVYDIIIMDNCWVRLGYTWYLRFPRTLWCLGFPNLCLWLQEGIDPSVR